MAETTDQAPKDLVGFLNYYLVTKAPFQLPDGFKEFLVKFGPWIMLVLMVLTLPLLFGMLGFGMAFAAAVPLAGALYMPSMIALCIAFVMRGIALPGLFARKMSGWNMAFYAQLVSLLASLLIGSIVGFIIGGVISLYFLFQIRAKYS